MPELRIPVMIRVEASWLDESGALRIVPACMEDKSVGGACIRIKNPVAVGARLVIHWRFEQFSGTVRYCRADGRDFLVGIQRDASFTPLVARTAPAPSPPPPAPSASLATPATMQNSTASAETKAAETAPARSNHETARSSHGSDEAFSGGASSRNEYHRAARFSAATASTPRPAKPTPQPALERKESAKGKKPMRHKWLDPSTWVSKESGPRVAPGSKSNSRGNVIKENSMPDASVPQKTTSAERSTAFQVDLLPMEDIYRAAGIMTPRKGYSINKVVEMVNSEHIRNLPKDMKRVALLMALDAAGVPIDEVLKDAKLRQEALDTYEAAQRKELEAEWARKQEECDQIEAELETVKAHYKARIGRNKDGVAREKAVFNDWLAVKQQERQSIAEAMEVCSKAPTPEMAKAASATATTPTARPTQEPARDSAPDLAAAKAAGAKP